MHRKTTLLLGMALLATVVAVASATMSATLCGDHYERLYHSQAGMAR